MRTAYSGPAPDVRADPQQRDYGIDKEVEDPINVRDLAIIVPKRGE